MLPRCGIARGGVDARRVLEAVDILAGRGHRTFAGLLIGLAAVEATVRSLWLFFSRQKPATGTEGIRLTLGRWLALALEFELAADILRTAIAPPGTRSASWRQSSSSARSFRKLLECEHLSHEFTGAKSAIVLVHQVGHGSEH